MKRVTLTITVETSLSPGQLFHAVADGLGDHRFGEIIEGRAFHAHHPNGPDIAQEADDMRRVRGSVESTVEHLNLDANGNEVSKAVGFSGIRKGGKR